MMSKDLAVVILAGGKGTRMKSDTPKALLPLCGKPMLWHLLEAIKPLKASRTVVVAGHGIEAVRNYLGRSTAIAHQKKQLGSGHALLCAKNALKSFKGDILVLYCDTPLLSHETISALLKHHKKTNAACTLLTVALENPYGYGRIIRTLQGNVEKIVEENDLSPEQKGIREINAGCYVFKSPQIFEVLKRIPFNEKKKEIYLTDAIKKISEEGLVEALTADSPDEVQGANTAADLLKIQEICQNRIILRLLEAGVVIRDPKTTTVDAGVKIGNNTALFPHTVIEEDSKIGQGCRIGPFARIRGESEIGDQAVVGNFVEIVRSKIGTDSQVKHLSYLGDARVGKRVNIGAGSITANFDGKNKFKTVILDGAQLGSGTVLIAPVTIGRNAKTGAGCVVPKNKNVSTGTVVAGVPARVLAGLRLAGKMNQRT